MREKFSQSIVRKFAISLGALAALASVSTAQVQVTTYHNDMCRTGLNPSETILTPANVNPTSFGLLFTLPVDGQVYAQPLYMPNVTIPGKGVHNVVYIATEHNSMYAFDADNNTGANAQPLWHVNFGPSVPWADTSSPNIRPELGITSTPVILPQQPPIIYVVSLTKTADAKGNPVYTQALHALDGTTGAEKLGGPVVIKGSVPGTGDGSINGIVPFNPLWQNSRAALLYVPHSMANSPNATRSPQSRLAPSAPISGTIYIAFGAHGDEHAYHGWLFGFDASNLNLLGVLNTGPNSKAEPSGYPIAGGGIWQGGCGPSSDGASIYFSTGNGLFNPAIGAYGDSILRMADRVFKVADYFAPANQQSLDDYDTDQGSGGVLLLPNETKASGGPSLLVQSGKEGSLFLNSLVNLGKNGITNNVVQELPHVMGSIYGAPAYFNGGLYFGPSYSHIIEIPVKGGCFPNPGPISETLEEYFNVGAVPSISSNEKTNGIVWAIQGSGGSGTAATLHAYDAGNLGVELYNSGATQGRDALATAIKFQTPTIVNGKVYVGLASEVGVFGIGKWPAMPAFSAQSGRYPNQVTFNVTESTPGTFIAFTTDGTIPTRTSPRFHGPVTLTSSSTVKARAFQDGAGASSVATADFLINPTIGFGSGLAGKYFANNIHGSAPFSSRLDPLINFDWQNGSPILGMADDHWSVEWSGYVEAETTGTHTFMTSAEAGLQVWINGSLVIDNSAETELPVSSGTICLRAGMKNAIEVKYIHNGGGFPLRLYWSGPGLTKELIPTSQLYPD